MAQAATPDMTPGMNPNMNPDITQKVIKDTEKEGLYDIFDTHAHYDDKQFDSDRDQLIESLPKRGVCAVVNAATDIETTKLGIEYSEKYPYFWTTAGFHPEYAGKTPKNYIDELERLLSHEKCVAIGEIGLDYYWDSVPRDVQKKVFTEQIKLSLELDLPVVIHDRDAHKDTLDIVKKYRPKGFFHCFSGSAEMALEVMALGMSLSLGGVVTFKNARHSVNVAAAVPLDRLLLETDAPYLAPVPFRGKRCDSTMIAHTARKIAEIRSMDPQQLLTLTKENAQKMYFG